MMRRVAVFALITLHAFGSSIRSVKGDCSVLASCGDCAGDASCIWCQAELVDKVAATADLRTGGCVAATSCDEVLHDPMWAGLRSFEGSWDTGFSTIALKLTHLEASSCTDDLLVAVDDSSASCSQCTSQSDKEWCRMTISGGEEVFVGGLCVSAGEAACAAGGTWDLGALNGPPTIAGQLKDSTTCPGCSAATTCSTCRIEDATCKWCAPYLGAYATDQTQLVVQSVYSLGVCTDVAPCPVPGTMENLFSGVPTNPIVWGAKTVPNGPDCSDAGTGSSWASYPTCNECQGAEKKWCQMVGAISYDGEMVTEGGICVDTDETCVDISSAADHDSTATTVDITAAISTECPADDTSDAFALSASASVCAAVAAGIAVLV